MDFQRVLRDRRSHRHFADVPVERSVIEALIASARWAPSAGNRQPWKVVALSPPAARDALATFEPRAWEMLYPYLKTIVARNAKAVLGDVLTGARLNEATVAFVDKEIFIRGEAWVLIVYQDLPPARDAVENFTRAAAMAAYRVRTRSGLSNKAKLGRFFAANARHAMTVSDWTEIASISNFMYALSLSAEDRDLWSCIQWTWALVGRSLARHLELGPRARVLGAVVVGHPLKSDDDALQRRVSERRDVDVDWR